MCLTQRDAAACGVLVALSSGLTLLLSVSIPFWGDSEGLSTWHSVITLTRKMFEKRDIGVATPRAPTSEACSDVEHFPLETCGSCTRTHHTRFLLLQWRCSLPCGCSKRTPMVQVISVPFSYCTFLNSNCCFEEAAAALRKRNKAVRIKKLRKQFSLNRLD